jgi:hypothetical protein
MTLFVVICDLPFHDTPWVKLDGWVMASGFSELSTA